MTSRERVLTAIARKEPDRTPADYKAEPEVNARMMAHFGVSEYEKLLEALAIDIRRVNPLQVGRLNKDLGDGVFEDYWGIRSVHLPAGQGGYDMHVRTPLWDAQSVEDLAAHDWPWPDIFDYSVMKAQRERWGEFLVMYEGADLFTRPSILRNMENVMLDLVLRPDMVHFLLEKFTAFYCEDVTRAFEATGGGIELYCEWSDFGTQRGLQISVAMFREFIAPYLKRLIDVVHSGGARFMLHSCGAVRDLIPDFLAIGVDVLDPIQVAAAGMNPAGLKRDFGDRLAFHGGICTQHTLPFGSPAEVREAVKDRVATLGRGGGYIIASSHDISADTPTENILAMYELPIRGGRERKV